MLINKRVKGIKYLDWLFALFLMILVTALRLPSFELPFDMNSGANVYHARLILNGEPLYSTHHPGHHMPGVYYTYALAFYLLGDSNLSVRLLLLPWTIMSAYLIYLVGQRLNNNVVGMLSAIIFTLLSSHRYLAGDTAETELFANLPIIAAILLSIDLILKNSRNLFFFFVGLLCSISFMYKSVFLIPLVISIFMVFRQVRFSRVYRTHIKTVIARSLWMGGGFIIPILIVIILYAWNDLLSRFLLVFSLGFGYVNQLSQKSNSLGFIIFPLTVLVINNPILLFLSFGGAFHILGDYWNKVLKPENTSFIRYGIVLWFFLSIITAGITGTGWIHYQVIVIPPLSLLAGWEIYRAYKVTLSKKNNLYSITLVSSLIVAILSMSFIINYPQYYHYIKYKLNIESYDEFLLNGGNPDSNPLFNVVRMAEYIRSRTNKEDRIYSWSDHAQIYYLADRRAPVDIIWPSYAEATGSYKRIFSPKTKYIIVGESIIVPQPDWFYEELRKSYYLEKEFGEFDLYRRIEFLQ